MINTFNVSTSGLAAARENVENVMNNIANENTPGYKKRTVEITEAAHIDERLTGRGVELGAVERTTNMYMYDNLTSETSKQANYEELSTMLSDIEAIFYETEDSGFSADLDRYFQSLENLRANPSSEIYKNDVKNTGKAIVDDLHNLYIGIEQREITSVGTAEENIKVINGLLSDIGNVNTTILESPVVMNDLYDKRDRLEQELAEYIDIDVNRNDGYELKIAGVTAVRFDSNVHTVDLSTTKVAQQDVYSDESSGTSNLVNAATWVNDNEDTVTYKFDNNYEITVTHGEGIDTDGDTVADYTVDKDNIIQALVHKINNDTTLKASVTAYNGQYSLDTNGNKVLETPTTTDHYLIIESNVEGDEGAFEGRMVVTDSGITSELDKNSLVSVDGTDNVTLRIYERDLTLKNGSLKPTFDNLITANTNNVFASYKERLDNFAKSLSDLSNSFIQNSDDTYVYGTTAVDVHTDNASRIDIGLFSGSTVKTLEFNDGIVSNLTQEKLDYLSSLQWKTDIDFDGTGNNNTSFSEYNRELRVSVAEDKENSDFKKDTQDSVINALQNAYDKITKVDKDEEMMNLIKFQAAYEANAKLISIVDEMLNTILGMKS